MWYNKKPCVIKRYQEFKTKINERWSNIIKDKTKHSLVTQNMFVKCLFAIKKIIHELIKNSFSCIVIIFCIIVFSNIGDMFLVFKAWNDFATKSHEFIHSLNEERNVIWLPQYDFTTFFQIKFLVLMLFYENINKFL